MKYSDYPGPLDRYKDLYTWRLIDAASFEFETCGNCQTEAPLHDFEAWGDTKRLCPVCSSIAPLRNEPALAAASLVLRLLGAYDDYEVVEVSE